MTREELTQAIRVKYPQWSKIDDETLTEKFLERYPVYRSQITNTLRASEQEPGVEESMEEKKPGYLSRVGTAIKNEFGKAIGSVKRGAEMIEEGDVRKGLVRGSIGPAASAVRAIYSPAGELISPMIEKGIEKASDSPTIQKIATNPKVSAALDTIFGGVEKAQEWAKENPDDAANLVDTITVAVAMAASKPAGKAAKATSEKTQQLGAKVGKEVSEGLKSTGQITKSSGKGLYETAFDLTTREAQMVQAFKAKVPLKERVMSFFTGKQIEGAPRLASQTALEKGIAGTESMVGVQAKKQAQSLWDDTIAPAVKGINKKIKTADMFKAVQNQIDDVADASKRKVFQKALESIKDDYKGISSLDYTTAQQIKSELAKSLPEKMFRGANVTGAANNVRKFMADYIRKQTYEQLKDVNIRQSYLDWGNLSDLTKFGVKAMTTGKLKGGFGSFVSGMWDLAVTPVKTVGGQVLYKAGNGMQFLGEKGIKTFGDYLSKFVK